MIKKIIRAIISPKLILKKVKSTYINYKERKINKRWRDQEYVLKNRQNFNQEYYLNHKNIREVEHHVGRFLNMKKIVNEIIENEIPGDVLEFGTWQGTSLISISNLFKNESSKKSFVGVDSFEGLPESSNFWQKGDFNNTSIEIIKKKIEKYVSIKSNIVLIKGWFNDPKVKKEIYDKISSVSLIHFDSDLGSSTRQALEISEKFLINRKKPMFFLFDDWGCHPDEVPDAFLNWAESNKEKHLFNYKKISSTNLTRYYKLNFNN